jgi:hypothetical protein
VSFLIIKKNNPTRIKLTDHTFEVVKVLPDARVLPIAFPPNLLEIIERPSHSMRQGTRQVTRRNVEIDKHSQDSYLISQSRQSIANEKTRNTKGKETGKK